MPSVCSVLSIAYALAHVLMTRQMNKVRKVTEEDRNRCLLISTYGVFEPTSQWMQKCRPYNLKLFSGNF